MTQTKLASPVPYQRGATISQGERYANESTTLYKGGLFSFLAKGEDSGGRNATILILRGYANEYRAKPGTERMRV